MGKRKPPSKQQIREQQRELTRDYLLTVLQTRTQKQAAEFLGIGERTVRRIKNEDNHRTIKRTSAVIVELGAKETKRLRRPTKRDMLAAAEKRLAKQTAQQQKQLDADVAYMREQAKLQKIPKKKIEKEIKKFKAKRKPSYIRKDTKLKRLKIPVPRLSVAVPFERGTRIDPSDPEHKRRVFSDVLSFDVSKLTDKQIFQVLKTYRKNDEWQVNIIYAVPEGGKSLGGRSYRKGGQSATGWFDIGMRDENEEDENGNNPPVFDDASLMQTINEMQDVQFTGRTKGKKRKQNIMWVNVQRRN